jgi:hypothetical protein
MTRSRILTKSGRPAPGKLTRLCYLLAVAVLTLLRLHMPAPTPGSPVSVHDLSPQHVRKHVSDTFQPYGAWPAGSLGLVAPEHLGLQLAFAKLF